MRNFNIKPPQIIISLFLITLVFLAYALEMNLVILFNESLVNWS